MHAHELKARMERMSMGRVESLRVCLMVGGAR